MNINNSKLGSFCSQFINVVIDKNTDPITGFLLKSFIGLLKEEQETTDQKVDKLIASCYKTGMSHLQDADMVSAERKQKWIEAALDEFRKAATLENALMAAKAKFYVAVCYALLKERELALTWFEQAYQVGQNLERKLVEKSAASKMDVATIISLPLTTIYGAAWLGYRYLQKNKARQALVELHTFMQSLTNVLVAYQSRLSTLQTAEQRERTYQVLLAQFADNHTPAIAPSPLPRAYSSMPRIAPPPPSHVYSHGGAPVVVSPPISVSLIAAPASRPSQAPIPQPTAMMAEVSVHGYLLFSTGQQMRLSSLRTIVGREVNQAESQISIDLASLPASNTVSHKHALIEAIHGTYTLTDLNSRNTTSVNGQHLASNCPAVIRDGDVLSFGGVNCTFRF